MVVDQNSLNVKKYFSLIIFFLLFTSKSYSNNFTLTKIIKLDDPWGSSFINVDEKIYFLTGDNLWLMENK